MINENNCVGKNSVLNTNCNINICTVERYHNVVALSADPHDSKLR